MHDHPTTAYFRHVRQRPDRVIIQDEWIMRVILLADKTTIHNAFFDRDFQEQGDEGQVF